MKKTKIFICLIGLTMSTAVITSCDSKNVINDEKHVTFYNRLKAGFSLPLKLFDIQPQVPYIRVDEFFKTFMKSVYSTAFNSYVKNNVYTFTNTYNNQTAKIDFNNLNDGKIIFTDYDSFFDFGFGYTPTSNSFTSEGKKVFTCVEKEFNKDKVDLAKTINLKNYDIKLVVEKDQYYYAPMATMIDIFMPEYPYVYNGKAFYYNEGFYYKNSDGVYVLSDYGADAKNKCTLTYNDSYKKFNYNELCLILDLNYGLKLEKSIDSFKTFFQQKGVENSIINGTYNDLDNELNQVFNNYLDDYGHTYINVTGSSIFEKNLINNIYISKHNEDVYKKYEDFITARNQYYSSIGKTQVPKLEYDEQSKTLVLNLDKFTFYPIDITTGKFVTTDTNSMAYQIYEANQMIQATPNYYDNIIINLTTNGGGYDYAELYLESWINGFATQYLTSSYTGSKSYVKYQVDVNFDGKIDESDTIAHKKVYKDGDKTVEKAFNVIVVTSQCSYSNANIFTGMAKENRNSRDGKTVFVGEKTDGGCCCTVTKNTVAGNSFNISSVSQCTYGDHSSFELGVDVDEGKTIPSDETKAKENYFKIDYLLNLLND